MRKYVINILFLVAICAINVGYSSKSYAQIDLNLTIETDFSWKSWWATYNAGFISDGASNAWMFNSYDASPWPNAVAGNWAISGSYDLPGVQHIWDPTYNDSVLLRKEFNVPVADSYTGTINSQVDNWYNIYFNGTFLGNGSYLPTPPASYNISTSLEGCETNVIGMEARDFGGFWGAKVSIDIIAHNVLYTPVALNASSVLCDGFTANWDSVQTADSYLLDISTDPNFGSFYGIYQDYDVGNVLSFSVGSIPSSTYYYRLRAKRTNVSGTKISCYSNVIEVDLDSLTFYATGEDTLCGGEDISLLSSGGPGASYQWSGPAGFSSTDSTVTINNAGQSATGNYIITVNTANCGTVSDTLFVLVIDNTGLSIQPTGPYCSDASQDTLQVSGAGGMWSGNGIVDAGLGIFDPTTAGSGDHQIWYIISGDCPDTAMATVTVTNGSSLTGLEFPNVFTPNNDNINDVYAPNVPGGGPFDLWVYNRWGVLLYEEINGTNGWSGESNGSAVPEGIYYWVSRVSSECSSMPIEEKGFIHLLRP